ncbi:MAG: hypothetical protein PUF51_06820, partial [Bifidobacteriaceae bacterium]|nr:hypothetical protein [Bifidobacteriaceae bacterium]
MAHISTHQPAQTADSPTFAERLSQALELRGLKQVDVVRMAHAAGLKIGKSHMSQYVSGKTIPRDANLAFLASTLHVSEEWLMGEAPSRRTNDRAEGQPSGIISETAHATASTAASSTASEHASPPGTQQAAMNAAAPAAQSSHLSDALSASAGAADTLNTTSTVTNRPITTTSLSEEPSMTDTNISSTTDTPSKPTAPVAPSALTKRRTFTKSHKLDNVLYDVRGPVVDEAARMEAEGINVLKLNIGNPAPFGFRTPDEVVHDLAHQLTETEGYSPSKGLFSARKAIMQYSQIKGLPNVTIDDIYTGNGVSELINLSMSALLDDGDE